MILLVSSLKLYHLNDLSLTEFRFLVQYRYMKKTLAFLSSFLALALLNSSCTKKKEYLFSFPSGSVEDYKERFYYEDAYFMEKGSEYNPFLSTCSLAFAMASFASNENGPDKSYDQRYHNGEDFLKKCGFKGIDVNQYYKEKPTADSLGVIFANKPINGKTLVAAGIRGANYESEWASNFTLGNGKDIKQAQGFYEASTIYLNSLKEYLIKYDIKGPIKLWSVGYSRAGATNNLAGGRIDQMMKRGGKLFDGLVSIDQDDLYCYCFEPPQGASFNEKTSPRSKMYSNIHNIVNDNDMVTKVAMSAFSFTRYGVDHYLPDSIRDAHYQIHLEKVLDIYKNLKTYSILGDYSISSFSSADSCSLDNVKDNTRINWTSGLFLNDFISELSLVGVENLDYYVNNIQSGIREIYQTIYRKDDSMTSLMDLGLEMVTHMLSFSYPDQLLNDLIYDTENGLNEVLFLLKKSLTSLNVEIDFSLLKTSLTSLFDAMIKTFRVHPDYFLTLINSSSIQAFGSAHYPELCLSHLMAQDPHYMVSPFEYDSNGDMLYLTADLDDIEKVSLEIKDRVGRVLGGFRGGSLIQDTKFSCAIDKNKLRIYFPTTLDYCIETENQSFKLELITPEKEKPVEIYQSKANDSFTIKSNRFTK